MRYLGSLSVVYMSLLSRSIIEMLPPLVYFDSGTPPRGEIVSQFLAGRAFGTHRDNISMCLLTTPRSSTDRTRDF